MRKVGRTIRRRRKEGKTDYRLRMGLLKSGQARVVVRRTNRYVIGQIVVSDIAQDNVIATAHSRELLSHGWPAEATGSLKSRPAAYLTGYLLARKAKKVKGAIFDIGLSRNIQGSRLYSFLKGVVDGGLAIPHGANALPSEEMLASSKKGYDLIEKIKGGIK